MVFRNRFEGCLNGYKKTMGRNCLVAGQDFTTKGTKIFTRATKPVMLIWYDDDDVYRRAIVAVITCLALRTL